ncbi:MAG: UDP-3-O-(3-hydroxymyristoyl)glucosamine N-acyltransferase [Candidatus Sumerlaeia bacterium]|nr:UDP-3-O-(3-hydroxymyristoyl)glucosamine N-acyltransferase [Candidatus Sumerlaeia bacterium]
MATTAAAPLTPDALRALLGIDASVPLPPGPFRAFTTLEEAGPEDLSFVARRKLAKAAETTRAAAVLVPQGVAVEHPNAVPVADLWLAALALLNHFHPPRPRAAAQHPTAIVPASCTVGEHVEIGPYCVLGEGVVLGDRVRLGAHTVLGDGVSIGEDSELHPRVTVLERCAVGRRVILHSGCVVGSDGFKYEVAGRRLQKVPQVGVVVIEDEVEIGANATLDRASFTETRIGARAKLDNLVHIAHNVSVGSDCVFAAQVGIAGSTKVGRGVMMGGQSGAKDNIVIGDGTMIGGQSGVGNDLPPKSKAMGSPSMPSAEYWKMLAIMRRLPELYEQLQALGFLKRGEVDGPAPAEE